MSSTTIQNFLTKRLLIERDIVTYRSLSRELAIHVNVAKNELATYHANASKPVTATYLLTGEVPAFRKNTGMDTTMQLDGAVDEESHDGEYVLQTKIVLVGEENLAGAISQFTRLQTTHVYSLSPSPIRDAGLLCGPTDVVRQIDNGKKGTELGVVVGKVIGAHVQIKAVGKVAPPVASPLKANPSVVVKPLSKEKGHVIGHDKTKASTKEKGKEHSVVVEKAKPTGKLDFSRAKSKDVKKEAKGEHKSVAETSASGAKTGHETQNKSPKEELKTGTKRKSYGRVLLSDSDDASPAAQSKPPSKTKTGSRVRKGVVLSDEEDIPRVSRRKRKLASAAASEAESDAEPSLKAMMDVDDDQVIRVTRSPPAEMEEQVEEESDQDIDTDPAPKAKRKPRKKKIIPMGRNGLKKKRIVKSRQTTDHKGYFMTEDYSSYESVDEEEPEPEPEPAKGKGKVRARTKEKEDVRVETTSNTSKSKLVVKESSGVSNKPMARGGKPKTAKPEQRSLANFFGPPKKQK